METRANYLVVGALIVLAFISLAIVVGVLARFSFDGEYTRLDISLMAPVRGLDVGGEVRYNGIKIGEVSRLRFQRDDPDHVIAVTRVDSRAPIRQDSIVRLEPAGLTGLSYIQIIGGSKDAPLLRNRLGQPNPQLEASEDQFGALFRSTQSLISNAEGALGRAEDLLAPEMIADLRATIANLRQLSESFVAANLPGQAAQAIASADQAVQRVGETAETATQAIAGLEPKLAAAADSLTLTLTEARAAMVAARDAGRALEAAIARIDREVTPEIALAAQDLQRALTGLDRVVVAIERNPQSFIVGVEQPVYEAPRR